jgi:FAD/FMN-containing dehydrogenase
VTSRTTGSSPGAAAGARAAALADALAEVVGPTHVLIGSDLKAPYETDWTRRFSGSAALVVRPADTGEVAAVLRRCREAGVAVVPQGGNTGLVGGGVPRGGEVLLSLSRLDRLGQIDRLAGQVTAGAGVTLRALQTHAAAADLAYPVDFAARDSATVGGMIATNAGGIRVLRYGSTRRQVLGIEAVTMDGRVVSRMAGLVKDNSGYDLAGLLAGSEGTLAVITAARLRLVPHLQRRVVALIAVEDLAAAQRILGRVRPIAPSLEAAEVFFAAGLELVQRNAGGVAPFAAAHPAYLLLECAARTDPTDELAEALGEAGEALDVAVATDGPARARLWALREAHTEAINAEGVPIKLDVSLPAARMGAFVDRVHDAVVAVAPGARTILFGHLGDGNLHVNVLGVEPDAEAVDEVVLRFAVELGGSISAEHGIGRAKRAWLPLHRDPTDLAVMGEIKRAFDPDGLLNPGVLLEPHTSHSSRDRPEGRSEGRSRGESGTRHGGS